MSQLRGAVRRERADRQPAAARNRCRSAGSATVGCANVKPQDLVQITADRASEHAHDAVLGHAHDPSVAALREVMDPAGLQHGERGAPAAVPQPQRAVRARAEHMPSFVKSAMLTSSV